MDWSLVYAELKGWQGAIGALLGFAGLGAGALFNSHLNRRRDERLRHDEAIAVASALYGEVVIIRRSLARMANAVGRRFIDNGTGRSRDEPFDRHFVEQVALPPLTLYPALAARIGLLPSQLGLEIVTFYSRAQEAQTWLQRLRSDPTRPYSYSVNYVLDPAIAAVTGVLPALRIIESLAGITLQEGTPDLERALSAQEFVRLESEH